MLRWQHDFRYLKFYSNLVNSKSFLTLTKNIWDSFIFLILSNSSLYLPSSLELSLSIKLFSILETWINNIQTTEKQLRYFLNDIKTFVDRDQNINNVMLKTPSTILNPVMMKWNILNLIYCQNAIIKTFVI